MKQGKVIIQNELGLHARAAATFAKQADRFNADVRVVKNGVEVNGKSIMELLTLAAPKGTEIIIKTHGSDEASALEFLCILVENRFGEDK